MTPKRVQDRGRKPAPATRSRWGRRSAWSLAAIAVAVVVAFSALRARAPRNGGPAPEESPAAGADPRVAYARAIELGAARHYVESLPWFRRASSGLADDWEVHYNLATALFQANLEVRAHRGTVQPASRSSLDRVAWTREALEELAIAQRLAPDSMVRMQVITTRANRLQTWGLMWDALAGFRTAAQTDPRWNTWAAAIERSLENPAATNGP